MAPDIAPVHPIAQPPATSPSWLHARAVWAGLSIIAIWLAVLFVGVFGGDFVSNSSANGFTKFPVVVFLLPFALPATIVVARAGFRSALDHRRGAPDEKAPARGVAQGPEEGSPGPSALRATRTV